MNATTENSTQIESITIVGRRWFDARNGNTYHTAEIIIDGKLAHKTDMEYGYDECYIQTAFGWLDENGYTDRDRSANTGMWTAPWRYCEENGIELHTTVSDGLKRDL